jgi:hypothetical protein
LKTFSFHFRKQCQHTNSQSLSDGATVEIRLGPRKRKSQIGLGRSQRF